MITVLSVVSDTMSSSSGTRGRGIGERRWMGEGGGIGPVEVLQAAEVDGWRQSKNDECVGKRHETYPVEQGI